MENIAGKEPHSIPQQDIPGATPLETVEDGEQGDIVAHGQPKRRRDSLEDTNLAKDRLEQLVERSFQMWEPKFVDLIRREVRDQIRSLDKGLEQRSGKTFEQGYDLSSKQSSERSLKRRVLESLEDSTHQRQNIVNHQVSITYPQRAIGMHVKAMKKYTTGTGKGNPIPTREIISHQGHKKPALTHLLRATHSHRRIGIRSWRHTHSFLTTIMNMWNGTHLTPLNSCGAYTLQDRSNGQEKRA